ncbi:hypothetical protein BDL97_04G081800 [Sphagnum fallax]|nr:hypothetical protein BDL97_04G081800 [Sphagnum fallax]KAH8964729.1 hypothetical protein BDL97_04G081800 [Sphagnum fallax]KAH8964730.1 hypothetical protein BDL97_04G081800 [Sphagnum fallax]KAH8964731.1 hypothetical protein BDL97_04G081800 [Sphagnum fallax]
MLRMVSLGNRVSNGLNFTCSSSNLFSERAHGGLLRPNQHRSQRQLKCGCTSSGLRVVEHSLILHQKLQSRLDKGFKRFGARLTSAVRELHHHFARVEGEDVLKAGEVEWGSKATALGISLGGIIFLGPYLGSEDFMTIAIAASAPPLAQMRPGGMLVEKLAENFKTSKVVEKVVTVVSGQTLVDPIALEKEVKEILQGEHSFDEWRKSVLDNAQNSLTTAVDMISNFTPESTTESLVASFQGFAETAAERFAAFELSALVGLGERWLIYIPLVILPMAWEEERRLLSEETQVKAERVRRELERIELKASLLEVIKSLDEIATQSRRGAISDIVEKLRVVCPPYETKLAPSDTGSTIGTTGPNDSFTYIPALPDLDGDWCLIYRSESNGAGEELGFGISGIDVKNVRQQVRHREAADRVASKALQSSLVAKNVAEIRLGQLGVVEVAIQGSWERLNNGQAGLLSFDTIMARPREILGNRVSDELPAVQIPLPEQLQQTAEWEVLYLDESLRINRSQQGQLFIFTKQK